jgi:triosephosphate isomerase
MSMSEIRHSISRIKAKYPGVRAIYGGSVTSQNTRAILANRDVDGVLIGGASLKIAEIQAILDN